MSRAFTREENNETAIADLGERPVSPHRNLVTRNGLAMIDAEIAALQAELAKVDATEEREKSALLARDLRYWKARRETAELVEPDPDEDVVRFGKIVSLEDEDGRRQTWRIVGEDEADPGVGTISHVSPMARALFGKAVGDAATVNGREWEIVSVSAEP